MPLSLIYARSENHIIGQGGELPWRLPDDFAHFKRTTMGRPIIMGRRTYEDHQSVLPGRTNIVLTSSAGFAPEGVVVARSLDEALTPYRDKQGQLTQEVFIIGGANLFASTQPEADRVYETVVHAEVEGDTSLPEFDFSGWTTTVLQEHPADDRHRYAFTVLLHQR